MAMYVYRRLYSQITGNSLSYKRGIDRTGSLTDRIWVAALYGAENWAFLEEDQKYLESL